MLKMLAIEYTIVEKFCLPFIILSGLTIYGAYSWYAQGSIEGALISMVGWMAYTFFKKCFPEKLITISGSYSTVKHLLSYVDLSDRRGVYITKAYVYRRVAETLSEIINVPASKIGPNTDFYKDLGCG